MAVDHVEAVAIEWSRWPRAGGAVGVRQIVVLLHRVDPDDASGVLLGHLIDQLQRPLELVVVRRRLAARWIDGYHFIHQLGPAISAWRVAVQLAVPISSRRILPLLRWERPERH